MKRNFTLLFFSLIFLFLMQSRVALGQATSVDTSKIVHEKTDTIEKSKKKKFSLFKRNRKQIESDSTKNDSLTIAQSDSTSNNKKSKLNHKKGNSIVVKDSSSLKSVREKQKISAKKDSLKGSYNEGLVSLEKESHRLFKRKRSFAEEDSLSQSKDSLRVNSKITDNEVSSDSLGNGIKDSLSGKLKETISSDNIKEGLKDKIGIDSLSEFTNTDALKNKLKESVPVIDAKQQLNGAKGLLLEKKDTYVTKNIAKLKSFDTKKFIKKQKDAIKPYGSISVGYEYGVLPFALGDNYPSGGYKTEGDISFLLMNVPLELNYYYTDIKNVVGFSNYFRLSFDANRYKEQLAQKIGGKDQILNDELGKLQLQQQKLMQKIEYLKFLESFPTYQMPATDSLTKKANLPSSGGLPNVSEKLSIKPDSLNLNSIKLNQLDSLGNMKADTSRLRDLANNPPNMSDSSKLKSKYSNKIEGIKGNSIDSSKISNYSKKYKEGRDSIKKDSTQIQKDSLKKSSNKEEDYFQTDSLKKQEPDSSKSKHRKRIFGSKRKSTDLEANSDQKIKSDSTKNTVASDSLKYSNPDSLQNDHKRKRKNRFELSHSDTTKTETIKPSAHDSIAECQADSAKTHDDYMRKKDSVANQMQVYKAKYDSINNEINIVKQKIEQVKNYINNPEQLINPYLSKFQTLLSHIKKFEIGLCHPSYSTFLVNNIPLQGINMEYEKNEKYFAFTYGTTINNLLYNTNTLEGTIQNGRNLYNYFDFTNLEAGRKVLSLKGGIGKREETHFYAGAMIGKGKSDYLSPTPSDPALITKESNLVLELDVKYKFSEQMSADLIFGKSSIQEGDLTMNLLGKAVNEIFSNIRSNAVLFRLNSKINKTNTKLIFTTRWVDPFFKSYGIGFLRSDNLRFEIKVEQPINSKIKYTIAYRREEDNLLKLYDYKNTLQSINNTLNIKFNRRFNLRLIYAPLFRELKSSGVSIKDKNNISTAILSFIPKAKKVSVQFNGLYSRYIISGDSTTINFENIAYTHQFVFRSGFKTDLNVSWFKNNLSDTLGNDTYLSVLDIGYTTKNKTSFVVGGKVAYKKNIEPQYGFVVRATVKIYKGLFLNAEMEKIIIGDYYNSFIIEKIQKFPYYCSLRLLLNF